MGEQPELATIFRVEKDAEGLGKEWKLPGVILPTKKGEIIVFTFPASFEEGNRYEVLEEPYLELIPPPFELVKASKESGISLTRAYLWVKIKLID